jgi:catechol 2,3-dioxygenase-like lactoylglutathione lyase family enzyme
MTMMIDHLSLPVADLARSRRLYDAALTALGYGRLMDVEEAGYVACGYGVEGSHEPAFWIGAPVPPEPLAPRREGQHIAFRAASRAAVDAWHAAALGAGAMDNGAPGLRPHYHAGYYAAYVIDPDGNRLEAVCHLPEA